MALARYQLTITDEAGNIVDGASVEVRNELTSLLPQVYSDRDGADALGNPFVAADGADAGFHVVGGVYKITATLGAFQRIWRYVGVGTASETDRFSEITPNVLMFGAVSGGSAAVNTAAFIAARNYCQAAGISQCFVPAGTYTLGAASGTEILFFDQPFVFFGDSGATTVVQCSAATPRTIDLVRVDGNLLFNNIYWGFRDIALYCIDGGRHALNIDLSDDTHLSHIVLDRCVLQGSGVSDGAGSVGKAFRVKKDISLADFDGWFTSTIEDNTFINGVEWLDVGDSLHMFGGSISGIGTGVYMRSVAGAAACSFYGVNNTAAGTQYHLEDCDGTIIYSGQIETPGSHTGSDAAQVVLEDCINCKVINSSISTVGLSIDNIKIKGAGSKNNVIEGNHQTVIAGRHHDVIAADAGGGNRISPLGYFLQDSIQQDTPLVSDLSATKQFLPYFWDVPESDPRAPAANRGMLFFKLVSGETHLCYKNSAGTLTDLGLALLKTGGVMTGDIQLAGDPDSPLKAATKQYVDNVAAGLDIKPSVRVATTTNITLSGAQTIDGVSVLATQRVLVKNQSSAAENGVYVCAAGAWARASDMDAYAEFPGAAVWVEEGSTQADTAWVCTADQGGSLGGTGISWTQFGGTGAFQPVNANLTAESGLTGAADRVSYYTGVGAKALATFTSVARTLLAQTTQALMRTTGLGLTTVGDAVAVAADAAAARTAIGLGTAALATIGTSGDTVPKNNTANTFSAAQAITGSTEFFEALRMTSTFDSANLGPLLTFMRDSATPAANDNIGSFQFQGRDSGGNILNYGFVYCQIADATDGSEDGKLILQPTVGGGSASYSFGNGAVFDGASGGEKGLGTLNAVGVYDDNSLLTHVPQQWAKTGRIDLARWDALVPDRIIPERRKLKPVMEAAPVDQLVTERDKDGSLVVRVKKVKRQAAELVPIFDEQGNGIGAAVQPMFEEHVVPERRIVREHYSARIFAKLIEGGLNPTDPASVAAYVSTQGALPGMPTEAEWEHGKFSIGEMQTRMCLATEIFALAFAGLAERVARLEAK